ncbi:MAG: glycosyltransferase family 4 protein [bacterium]|nr:glycosyltransferase family 4 protein [bacterium]
MKICFYTRAWRSSTGWQAQLIAQNLANCGFEVIFIAPLSEPISREPSHSNLIRKITRRELISGSKLSRRLSSIFRVISGLTATVAARLRTNVFFITIPDPLIFSIPTIALLRLTGAKVVYLCHDPLPHAWKFPRSLRALERAQLSAMYNLANELVVLAPSAAKTLRDEFSINPSRIHVVDHGPLSFEVSSPIPASRTLLLFGTLRRNKGIIEAIEGVVEARARGLDVRLLIAGAPHEEDSGYWTDCERIISLNSDAFDLELGFIDEDRISGLIAASDAFLLPYTDFDSQSGVAILAGANGRPVIGSNSGGIRGLLESGQPGIMIASPVAGPSVAHAIQDFYATNIDEWQKKCAAYRLASIDAGGWKNSIQGYVSVLSRYAKKREI